MFSRFSVLAPGDEGYRVTAQMVLVCCWRSMKEVAMLLGQLCQSLPLHCSDGTAQTHPGLITEAQVRPRHAHSSGTVRELRSKAARSKLKSYKHLKSLTFVVVFFFLPFIKCVSESVVYVQIWMLPIEHNIPTAPKLEQDILVSSNPGRKMRSASPSVKKTKL